MNEAVSDAEALRLDALHAYRVLDTPSEPRFDRIARLAADLLGTPIALITLLDADRQFFKSHIGVDLCETPRSISFCAHAIGSDAPLVVPDLARDERFEQNPFVTEAPHVRFYAGVPLRVASGHRLGTLCVIDTQPRTLTDRELDQLKTLAALVVDELELTRRTAELERAQAETQRVLNAMKSGFFTLDAAWRFTHLNHGAELLLRRRRDELLGKSLWEEFPDTVDTVTYEQYHRAVRDQIAVQFDVYFEPLDMWFEARAYPFEGGLSVYLDDVTQAKLAERRLRASERRYEALAQASASTVWRVSADGVSEVEMLMAQEGREHRRLVDARNWAWMVPDADRPRLLAAWEEAVRTKSPLELEIQGTLPNGRFGWYDVRCIPVLDDAGEVCEWIGTAADITARKQAQETILESEARFRSLVQNSAEVITLLSEDGMILDMSKSSERIAGHLPEARIGCRRNDFTHPDDVPLVDAALEEALRGEPGVCVVYRFRNAQGDYRWVESNVTNLLGDLSVRALVLNSRDVTERVEAQQRIEASEQKYRVLAEESGQLVYDYDLARDTSIWSGNVEGITGEQPEAVGPEHPTKWADRLHPDDAPRVLALFEEAIRTQGSFKADYRLRHAKGPHRYIEDRGSFVPSHEGGPLRMVGVMTDVTERRWNAEALRRSERRYRTLSRLVKSFAYSFEVPDDGAPPTLTWITGSVEDIIGFTARELEGIRWGDLLRKENQVPAAAHLSTVMSGEPCVDVLHLITKDGRERWVQFDSQPEVDPETGRVVRINGAGQDVTAHHEAAAALLDAQHQAEEARVRAEEMVRLKDAFLANMSHEIRTPMTAILGFTELLRDEVTEEGREFVDLIEAGGRRLKDTLTSVLELSQLQSGQMQLRPARLDVAALVTETTQLLQKQAADRGVSLHVVAPVRPLPAVLDQAALGRILTNLTGNAIKFTPAGGAVTVTATHEGEHVCVTVADTGIGIAASFLPHLFDEFRQESQGLSRGYEGAGLGLTITKRLVDLMGGTISVESQKGQGTTLTLRFLHGQTPAAGALEPAPARPSALPRVLLVEDDAATRLYTRKALGRTFEVVEAGSVAQARAAATVADAPFDLVLLDINLGDGASGEDLLPELRLLPSCQTARVTAMTAYALPGDQARFLKAGFDTYLPKPFSRAELLEAVALTGA